MRGQFAALRRLRVFDAVVGIVLLISVGDAPRAVRAQQPVAAPLKNEKRVAKPAERIRLWDEADALRAAGKFDEAIDRLKRHAELHRELFGENTGGEAEGLERIALNERDLERWAEARAAVTKAIAIREKYNGLHDWHTADARLLAVDVERWEKLTVKQRADLAEAGRNRARARKLLDEGDYHRSLPLAQAIVQKRRKILGDRHRETADALVLEGSVCLYRGDYPTAGPCLEQARSIREQVLGKRHPDYAEALHSLAWLFQHNSDYAQAEVLYKQAIEIRRNALGVMHSDYAATVCDLAGLYDAMGDYSRAEPLYKQALEIRKLSLGETHPHFARSVDSLGLLYKKMGDYARAERLYQQALEIRKKSLGETHPEYAVSLNNLGFLYKTMGDYARAEPLLQQALEIRKKSLGETHPDYANSLNNLGVLYDDLADYARSEQYYQRALAIRKKSLGEMHPDYATSLNNLALVYKEVGDYARAEPLYQQALAICKKVQGEAHPSYATSLLNLAALYSANGDYSRAEPLYQQALEIDKRAYGETHPGCATDMSNLAGLYRRMGDYERAAPIYRQTLAIRRKCLGEAHPDYAKSLRDLGTLELDVGRSADAKDLLRQAVRIERRSIDLTAAIQSEQQQLILIADARNYLDKYLTAALAANVSPEEIYAEVAAWKGSVSAQQQLLRARQRALAHEVDTPVGQLFQQLESQTRRLATLTREVPKPEQAAEHQRAVQSLREAVDTLEQRLSHLDPDFHRAWAGREVSPESLRQALPAAAALVDLLAYWHYLPAAKKGEKATWERRIVAFVLRHHVAVECVPLGATATVEALVNAWRDGCGQIRMSDGKMPGIELRHTVWEPLAPHLVNTDTVIVSPDGALAQLPWGALPGQKPGTFLIEERVVAVIAIPQLLPELLKHEMLSGPPPALLLAGDIDYGGDPGSMTGLLATRSAAAGRARDGSLLQFNRLEAAQAELSSIRDWFEQSNARGEVQILRRLQATEGAFRDEAPKHPWLHLITHGFFAPDGLVSPASEATPQPTDNSTALAGIGAVLTIGGSRCLVKEVNAGGAAHKDGRLKAEDEITAVADGEGNWVAITGKTLAEIIRNIRGPLGSTVRLRVRPHHKPESEVELALVRAALPAPVVKTTRLRLDAVNPGLLSGLAFAGANTPPAAGKDDGILTALEVSSLDLSKVDTVVLSACETGLGQVAGGEGLLGLQRAFQVAGAKTVVASLWKVPDAATSRLMQRFYENMWDKRMGKLAALREAQIYMLRDQGSRALALASPQKLPAGKSAEPEPAGLPPYYWAAFVLSGDWR